MKTGQVMRNFVIAGGGTAGWMTAAALSRLCEAGTASVTLVESDAIGTVGVGEATIPPIVGFNQLIGLNETDFIREAKGTFKLGIEFDGWRKPGHRYMHPFGTYGRDIEAIKFYQLWLRLRAKHAIPEIGQFSLSEQAAYSNRFSHPNGDPRSVLSSLAYAYHFDAGLYAQSLRRLSERRGVRRIEGRIDHVEQCSETGRIKSLNLEGERQVEGDFFIDCTGFRSLLIGQTLDVPFEDWSHWLPCNRAVTVASDPMSPLPSYTQSVAKEAGWRWRIPLQHRTGNGYVYCSDYLDSEAAEAQLLSDIGGAPLGDPKHLTFTTGRRAKFYEKNCCAIGLSSGFLEPLESTSIHLIQTGISKLVALLPDQSLPSVEADTYNRLAALQFDQVRDFLILHYIANERIGEPFWDRMREMDIPDTLKQRLDLFKSKGRIFRYQDELFDEDNWIAVLIGQNVMPAMSDPMADTLPEPDLLNHFKNMSALMENAAKSLPDHADYIQRMLSVSNSGRPS